MKLELEAVCYKTNKWKCCCGWFY